MAEAARFGPVVPALIVDGRREAALRASPRRAAFYCGAVRSLAGDLAAKGAPLVVRRGPYASTARRLARELGAKAVVWSAGFDGAAQRADRDLQSVLEEGGFRAVAVADAPAVGLDESDAARSGGGSGYRSYPAYVQAWRALAQPPEAPPAALATVGVAGEALPEPAEFGSPEPPEPSAGAAAAQRTLDDFLAAPALHYAAARTVPSVAGTSRLGAHLSFGTIAARTIRRRLAARSADPFLLAEERWSLQSFGDALARRDFFLQLAWFSQSGDLPLQSKMRDFPFARSHRLLDAWLEGRTGYPLVDAGMRELRATGWMHPHVRLVAASFCCFDLGVDWRVGRDAWDRWLVEDDRAVATGNWQWVAGVGADLAAYPRIYNPQKQARRVDPSAAYVRTWIPELASLPAAEILDPPARAGRPQLMLPMFDGAAYPLPVVDHAAVASAFLQRYGEYARR
jgi:deoxyribodipyrimidine photo-lyase